MEISSIGSFQDDIKISIGTISKRKIISKTLLKAKGRNSSGGAFI
jgi:hypothetical protein